jgi:hypothetical protein
MRVGGAKASGELAEGSEQALLPFPADAPATRPVLVARWLDLTRSVLPRMAASCRWPIINDHCFMRVCLDISLGAPWHTCVKRPAIRNLTIPQLKAAIATAEAIAAEPQTLEALNRKSIRWRHEATGRSG